jgi:MarR family transcriptional regulator, organic hydroperoxide resistance regulator
VNQSPNLLDEVNFYLGRAYYNYVGMLESVLREEKLNHLLPPGTGHVMAALYERDDRIIKQLVECTLLSPSTLTGILGKMKKAKIIIRRRDPVDRRAVRIRLTPLGRSLRARFIRCAERINEILCAGFDKNDIQKLKEALTGMIANMRRHIEEVPVLACQKNKKTHPAGIGSPSST